MSAVTVTEADWDCEVLTSVEVVVVALCSAAAGPCRNFRPVIDAVARQLAGAVRVLSLDLDANSAVARRYEVSSLPTVLIFRGGQLCGRLVGGRSKDRLVAELCPYLL